MSPESISNTPKETVNSYDDLTAARELIAGNEVLRTNPRVVALSENDFVTEDGVEVDAGNFLTAILAYIEESGDTKTITTDDIATALESSGVVHSRAPELEQQVEERPN